MKNADPLLIAALAQGVQLTFADIFDILLADGTTTYHWTTYSIDLTIPSTGLTYLSQSPFLTRSKWNVKNTMEVPELDLYADATLASFSGSIDLISQLHNGLLDGAQITFYRQAMQNRTDVTFLPTLMFGGVVADCDLDGIRATIRVKGANNRLDQYAPRKVFQVGCVNTFCDPGCTLVRGSFTSSFVVAASPTPSRVFVPWVTPPGTPSLSQFGTLKMTSGNAAGQSRNVIFADSTGCLLAFPLYAIPAPGDTFTVFQGCDKTITTCSARSNTQNNLAFPFVPSAETGI